MTIYLVTGGGYEDSINVSYHLSADKAYEILREVVECQTIYNKLIKEVDDKYLNTGILAIPDEYYQEFDTVASECKYPYSDEYHFAVVPVEVQE